MTGWEAVLSALWALVWVWIGVCGFMAVWITWSSVRDMWRANRRAVKAWQEGYDQGVDDERLAAAVDIPEYRIPKRQNPYGKNATNKGDPHGH